MVQGEMNESNTINLFLYIELDEHAKLPFLEFESQKLPRESLGLSPDTILTVESLRAVQLISKRMNSHSSPKSTITSISVSQINYQQNGDDLYFRNTSTAAYCAAAVAF
jgi:hypothetical protein